MIRPPALRPGDTVAVVAPSSPTAAHVPRRLARGVAELEARGFRVRLGEHVGDAAATREAKLADLHAAFADEEVRAVVCTIGGYDSHQLLDGLDFDLVAANPKIFCGYSDITALNVAVAVRTRLVTFMGPMLLPEWAEFGGMLPYTWTEWEATVMRPEPRGAIGTSTEWTAERTLWDKEDDRPRVTVANAGPRCVRGGSAAGPLAPANLSTLLLFAGTTWWPALDGAILALEAAEEEIAWWVERSLHQLRQMGVYERAAGIAFGRTNPASELPAEELDRILVDATRGTELPIVVDLDFGHTAPEATLPWGVRAELDADAASLALVEPAVA